MFRKKEIALRRGFDSNEVIKRRTNSGKKGKRSYVFQVATFDWFLEGYPEELSQYLSKSKKNTEVSKLIKSDVSWLKVLKSGGMKDISEVEGCEEHFKNIFRKTQSNHPIILFLKKFVNHVRDTVDYMCKSAFYKIDKFLKDYSVVADVIVDVIIEGYSQLVKVKRKFYPLEIMREEIRRFIFDRNDQDMIRLLKTHFCTDELQLDFLKKREIFLLERIPFTEFGKDLSLTDNLFLTIPYEEPIQLLSRLNSTLEVKKMLDIVDECFFSIFTTLFIALDELNEEFRITDVDLSLIIAYVILNCDVDKVSSWIEYVRIFSNYFEEYAQSLLDKKESVEAAAVLAEEEKKKKEENERKKRLKKLKKSKNKDTSNPEQAKKEEENKKKDDVKIQDWKLKFEEEIKNLEEEYLECHQKLESLFLFSEVSEWILNQDFIDIRFGDDIQKHVDMDLTTFTNPPKALKKRNSNTDQQQNLNIKKEEKEEESDSSEDLSEEKDDDDDDDEIKTKAVEDIEIELLSGTRVVGQEKKESEETAQEASFKDFKTEKKKRIQETIEMGSEKLMLSKFKIKTKIRKRNRKKNKKRRNSFGGDSSPVPPPQSDETNSAPTSPNVSPDLQREINRRKRFTISFGSGGLPFSRSSLMGERKRDRPKLGARIRRFREHSIGSKDGQVVKRVVKKLHEKKENSKVLEALKKFKAECEVDSEEEQDEYSYDYETFPESLKGFYCNNEEPQSEIIDLCHEIMVENLLRRMKKKNDLLEKRDKKILGLEKKVEELNKLIKESNK